MEMRASGLQLTEDLRRDLDEVIGRHGGRLEGVGHPTTTLEDYFLRVVEESRAHPGRRYLPEPERPLGAGPGPAAAPGNQKVVPVEGAAATGIKPAPHTDGKNKKKKR